MKYLIIFTLIIFSINSIAAGGNSSGPNSPVVVGKIKSAKGKTVEVQQGEYLRKLTITEKSNIVFVSFVNDQEKMKASYPVKAKVENNIISTIYITLPVNNVVRPTDKFMSLSTKELYKKTDVDGNGLISYVELATYIYYSPKHAPDTFHKADSDKSKELNFKEFENILKRVSWWSISRKSPSQWISTLDKNKNGKISMPEFEPMAGKSHLEARFKRYDNDKSNDLNLAELTRYIQSVMQPRQK